VSNCETVSSGVVFQNSAKMAVARVYVGRVSNYVRERDVEKFFKGFGRIRDVMVKNGYCFVVSAQLIVYQYCISSMAIVAIQHENLQNYLQIVLTLPGMDLEILGGGGWWRSGDVAPSGVQGQSPSSEFGG